MVYKCLNIAREIQEVSPTTLSQPKENTSTQNETELERLHRRNTHIFRHTAYISGCREKDAETIKLVSV